ncbi:GNAT family N-acetyltransferase [Pseudomaricurvus alcaniphilus]|uniref:GNAT family N-acetyltransferase n=1 Tax=Pseudomaricurvus alcaniphilus TaxID=1166482 RepID=UPI001407E144|nr:GNAT family N-acetyltransferase [Pseudomaricurvus alcaniphilus]NHN36701.1 GNAT family N-acetyltransferase [Pseudomaricurvus alcaniphilus]
MTGLYSSHYLPPVTDVAALKELLHDILATENWDVLRFSAVDEGGDLHRALTSLAGQEGWTLTCRPDFEHWYLRLDSADCDGYFAQLPGALRSTLKRKGAKVSSQFQVLFDCCDQPEQLAVALDAYQQVYANSWKNPELYPDFIPELCHWAARQGWLRLGVMYLDRTPVAAQIWLVLNGEASIFKLAYDDAYQQWSVGSLLTAFMVRRALNEDNVTSIDYGKGGESYKKDWMSGCLQRVQLECYNSATLAGRVMALRHAYLPRLRDRLLDRTT